MALALGRKGWIGLGKEVTPGVPVTPSVYLPFTQHSLQEKHDPIADVAAKGIRETQYASVQGKQWGEGDFQVNLDSILVGHLLLWTLGTVTTSTVSGAVKSHVFTRNNSNTPQTYSLHLDRVTDRKLYPYATAKSLELSFSDSLASVKVSILAQHPLTTVSGALTVTSGIIYAWKDAFVGFATTISGAVSAALTVVGTPTKLTEFTMTIDNASAPSWRSGVQQPASIDHTTFRVSGSFKILFETTAQLDNFNNLTKQSMAVRFIGRPTGVVGYNEQMTIQLPLIRLQSAVIDVPIDGFAMGVYTYEAEYDPTMTLESVDISLQNTNAAY